MKQPFKYIIVDFYRFSRNTFLMLSPVIILFSLLQPVVHEFINGEFDNALEMLDRTSGIGAMREIECAAYSIIASQVYLSERKSGYTAEAVMRIGRQKYLSHCLLSASVCSVISALVAYMLFISAALLRGLPLYPTNAEKLSEITVSGSNLLTGSHPGVIWIVTGSCFIISSTSWTLSALAVSACSNNSFLVVLSPVLLSFFLHAVMRLIDTIHGNILLLSNIDYYYLGRGITNIADPWAAMRMTTEWYLPIVILASIVFWCSASWRIRHG